MRLMIVLVLLFHFVLVSHAQDVSISLCCEHYKKGALRFSIVNESDSAISLTFQALEQSKGSIYIRYFEEIGDTVLIKIISPYETPINSSYKVKYYIDGKPKNQIDFAPKEKIEFGILGPKHYLRKVRHIKLRLLDGNSVTKELVI